MDYTGVMTVTSTFVNKNSTSLACTSLLLNEPSVCVSERPSVKQNRRQEVKQTPKKSQNATPGARGQPVSTSGSKVTKQPSKGQGQGQAGARGQKGQQGRGRRGEVTDTDTSMTLSAARDTTRDLTQDTTADTYTSDESTPR